MAQRTKAERVAPLSRDRILLAAVAVADQGGFDSLSMRNLAQELGAAPMSLYRHVANKDDLLDGMIDIVFSEIEFPVGGGDWRLAMRHRAISTREALRRHPWAVGLMESGRRPGPANLAEHNATMACLREEAGLPFRMAVHAYSIMDSYIYGFALQEESLPSDLPAEAEARREAVAGDNPSVAEEFPHLAEVVAELQKSGFDYNEEFEWGLDLILEGIERQRDSAPARRD
jgi:AcrR family transcriptional regulator